MIVSGRSGIGNSTLKTYYIEGFLPFFFCSRTWLRSPAFVYVQIKRECYFLTLVFRFNSASDSSDGCNFPIVWLCCFSKYDRSILRLTLDLPIWFGRIYGLETSMWARRESPVPEQTNFNWRVKTVIRMSCSFLQCVYVGE